MGKVLVTGGTGFVGNHVVRRLCAEGLSVRALVRPTSSRQSLAPFPVEIVEGDLRDRDSLQRAVIGCESVVHVAADYRLWVRHPQDMYDSNVQGTENLLAAAFEHGVSRFVYTSTNGILAYSGNGRAATEEDIPEFHTLQGNYKRSKFLAERIALRYAQQGHPVVIVNPTAVVGEGDSKPTDTGRIIRDFLNRRMPAYMDTGLNLVDVRDVAEGHWLALQRGRPGERYILGGENMTFREILTALSRLTGLPAPSLRLPYSVVLLAGTVNSFVARLTGHPPRIPVDAVRIARYKMFVSSAKAERELGYRPGPVQDALARAIEWFRSQGLVRPKCG